jgi:hypothetical protein
MLTGGIAQPLNNAGSNDFEVGPRKSVHSNGATGDISMAGCRFLHRNGGLFTIAASAALLLCMGHASADTTDGLLEANASDMVMASGSGAGCCDSCCCPEGLGICETITESIFGHPDPCCWDCLPLHTLFSEGWRQPWVPSPNGSGGAPRQGWINAADGNMYRLNFMTFAQAFKSGPQDDAYLGAYTLYTHIRRSAGDCC